MKIALLAAASVTLSSCCGPLDCKHTAANKISCSSPVDAGCPPPPRAADAGVSDQTGWPCDSCYSRRIWPDGTDIPLDSPAPVNDNPTCQLDASTSQKAMGPDAADWFGQSSCTGGSCGSWKDFPVKPGAALKIVAWTDPDGGCSLDDDSFDVQEWVGCGWSYTDAFLNSDPAPGEAYTDFYDGHGSLVRIVQAGLSGFHVAVCAAPDRACAWDAGGLLGFWPDAGDGGPSRPDAG